MAFVNTYTIWIIRRCDIFKNRYAYGDSDIIFEKKSRVPGFLLFALFQKVALKIQILVGLGVEKMGPNGFLT